MCDVTGQCEISVPYCEYCWNLTALDKVKTNKIGLELGINTLSADHTLPDIMENSTACNLPKHSDEQLTETVKRLNAILFPLDSFKGQTSNVNDLCILLRAVMQNGSNTQYSNRAATSWGLPAE